MADSEHLDELLLPPYPMHPGPWLLEELEARGLTLEWLSEQTGRPLQELLDIVEERALFDEAQAADLERVLDIDAQFWTNGVKLYRLTVERDRQRETSRDAATAAD